MPLSSPCVLALDVGSSSVRAQMYDRGGHPPGPGVAARRAYAWRTTPDGGMETDGDALAALCFGVLDEAVAAARAARVEVAAVALATFWHGVMGTDAAGEPVTPLYAWGDTRARAAAARLRERLDAAAYHARTGCFAHESYPAAKVLWLRGPAGDSFPRAAAWVGPGEHLEQRLFGRRRSSLSMASGTGLLDVRGCRWDAAALAAVGIGEDALPPLSDEPLRGLLPELAARWPELAGVPWFPALGDGACASFGSGAWGRGRVGLTVGTSAAVRVLRADADPVVPPDLWCYRLDAARTVAGRALSNGGNAFAWLTRTLALPPPAELEAALAAMEPDAHGLTVVPTLVGERPPLSDPREHASVRGMTAATTPVQVARAWLEAVAFRLGDAVDAVERAFGPVARVVASGGALHASPAWARIVADVVGRPLLLAGEGESTTRGAALLALERLGLLAVPEEATAPAGERIDPDPRAHERYRAARGRAAAAAR